MEGAEAADRGDARDGCGWIGAVMLLNSALADCALFGLEDSPRALSHDVFALGSGLLLRPAAGEQRCSYCAGQ